MALKKTQSQIKRKFRKQIQDLEFAIFGKCYECSGFQTNGYADCEIKIGV